MSNVGPFDINYSIFAKNKQTFISFFPKNFFLEKKLDVDSRFCIILHMTSFLFLINKSITYLKNKISF
jgi:hypothetical protein